MHLKNLDKLRQIIVIASTQHDIWITKSCHAEIAINLEVVK